MKSYQLKMKSLSGLNFMVLKKICWYFAATNPQTYYAAITVNPTAPS